MSERKMKKAQLLKISENSNFRLIFHRNKTWMDGSKYTHGHSRVKYIMTFSIYKENSYRRTNFIYHETIITKICGLIK